jgi:hypothetical protein
MRGLYRGFIPYLFLSCMTNGLLQIQKDGRDQYDPRKRQNRILLYVSNASIILWRIMTSLEYKQPATLRKGLIEFKIKDLGNRIADISFIFRGLIPISLAMGLQYVSLGLGQRADRINHSHWRTPSFFFIISILVHPLYLLGARVQYSRYHLKEAM